MNISMNPNGELYQSAVNAPGAIDIPESFLNEARQFRELNMRYACAIREVKTKLEVLNDDLAVRNQRNPIQMIKSRVKKPESIIEKLHRRGFPISVESVRENLYDVAEGQRIPQLPYDHRSSGILLRPEGKHARGGPDPDDRDGLLGESGSSDEV